jgi:hypothetical protein
MGYLGIRLKSSTDTYAESNIRPISCEIQKAPNHTPIKSGVHTFSCEIRTNFYTCAHGSANMTLTIQTRPLDQSFAYLD